ncbi:MAG: hypothetical protein WC554_02930 [Clostridia bacterium]|jgi:hypothetical protein
MEDKIDNFLRELKDLTEKYEIYVDYYDNEFDLMGGIDLYDLNTDVRLGNAQYEKDINQYCK